MSAKHVRTETNQHRLKARRIHRCEHCGARRAPGGQHRAGPDPSLWFLGWVAGLLVVFVLLVIAAAAFAAPAHAASLGTVVPVAAKTLEQVIRDATAWVVGIIATVATLFLTLGGVQYLVAGGDPAQVERAKSAMRNAGIGYALAILAPALLDILRKIVGA